MKMHIILKILLFGKRFRQRKKTQNVLSTKIEKKLKTAIIEIFQLML